MDLMYRQILPELYAREYENYTPDPSDLFSIVVLHRMTAKEIAEIMKGSSPSPSTSGIYQLPTIKEEGVVAPKMARRVMPPRDCKKKRVMDK